MDRIVVALGGNALIKQGKKPTVIQHTSAIDKTTEQLESIFKSNQVVITHGNGPQVGNLLLQQQSTDKVPESPLSVLDAMSQGSIGYLITRSVSKLGFPCVTIITRVAVDPSDKAFKKPIKPIGPFYEKPLNKNMKMDAGRGYRLVVPSPEPLDVLEKDAITTLLKKGFIVVAAGGGGIPVTKHSKSINAVIDKDKTSALLANEINAKTLIFITSIDNVFLNFGKSNQRALGNITVKQAEKYLKQGHFSEGSMQPKIESAIRFIKNGGKKAVICSIKNIKKSINGNAGTIIS